MPNPLSASGLDIDHLYPFDKSIKDVLIRELFNNEQIEALHRVTHHESDYELLHARAIDASREANQILHSSQPIFPRET